MKTSDAGVAMIERFEGCRLSAYRDEGGALTIGYGHLVTPAEKASGRFDGILLTKEKADAILREDLAKAEGIVAQYVKAPLTPNQHAALVSLTFNCGAGPLVGTLGKMLTAGRYDLVPAEMQRWVHLPDKSVSRVLVARRAAEAHLFATPDDPPPAAA